MKEGILETIYRLHCPYCKNKEDENELGRYLNFEFIKEFDTDPLGAIPTQIWKCLKCNKLFTI